MKKGGHNHEPARQPEDLARFIVERMNAGDVEGVVALYESGAVLVIGSEGQTAVGSEAIRAFYTELLEKRPKFELGEQSPTIRNGNLALTSSILPNGIVTAEVARRQSNGTWLWIIDQPAIARKR